MSPPLRHLFFPLLFDMSRSRRESCVRNVTLTNYLNSAVQGVSSSLYLRRSSVIRADRDLWSLRDGAIFLCS